MCYSKLVDEFSREILFSAQKHAFAKAESFRAKGDVMVGYSGDKFLRIF